MLARSVSQRASGPSCQHRRNNTGTPRAATWTCFSSSRLGMLPAGTSEHCMFKLHQDHHCCACHLLCATQRACGRAAAIWCSCQHATRKSLLALIADQSSVAFVASQLAACRTFYELYEDDAQIASSVLEWKLTVTGVGHCRQVGCPERGLSDAIRALTEAGLLPQDVGCGCPPARR
jgi:MutS domain I